MAQYATLLQSTLDQIDLIFGAANTSMRFVFEDNRSQLKIATSILANDTKNALDYVVTTIATANAALLQTSAFVTYMRNLVRPFFDGVS